METQMDYFIEKIFNKSKNQLGNIYLCNVRHRYMNIRTKELTQLGHLLGLNYSHLF